MEDNIELDNYIEVDNYMELDSSFEFHSYFFILTIIFSGRTIRALESIGAVFVLIGLT